mmetsp:Transcript_16265/g.30699  ORF Transcript_16265/g.30699 Transcript_16265/m.30699 type:complete len:198 (-) Transcript_16265:146-739(-)
MAGETFEGDVLQEIELKIDIRTASMLVIPKSDEINDSNMPRNLHNAAELFLRAGMVDAARNVKEATSKLLDMYASDPDGKTNVNVGRACVCWSCGHCGVPKGNNNNKNSISDDVRKVPPGPCSKCGEKDQINWIKVYNPTENEIKNKKKNKKKKEELPWIEAPELSEEEKKKKEEAQLAAKRKEVEEQVKRALAERV